MSALTDSGQDNPPLRVVLAALSAPLIVCDPNGCVKIINEAARAFLAPRSDLVETKITELCAGAEQGRRLTAALDSANGRQTTCFLGLFWRDARALPVNLRIRAAADESRFIAFVPFSPIGVVELARTRPSLGMLSPDDCVVRLLGGLGELSGRQFEVFEGLAEGCSIRGLEGRLGVSRHTVKNHIRSIYARLSLQSRDELYLRLSRVADLGSPRPRIFEPDS